MFWYKATMGCWFTATRPSPAWSRSTANSITRAKYLVAPGLAAPIVAGQGARIGLSFLLHSEGSGAADAGVTGVQYISQACTRGGARG
jgi:hypothetical protein